MILTTSINTTHNLDSQLVDKVLELLPEEEWAISIHDAILTLPGGSSRKFYTQVLQALRAVRTKVLNTYKQSIGATSKSADIAWAKLMAKVEQLCSAVPFAESALK